MSKIGDSLISVIGIGPGSLDFLTPVARDRVTTAELVVGSSRLLTLFPDISGEKRPLDGDISNTVDFLATVTDRDVAVIVSGDPGLFSLMRKIRDTLGVEKIEVIPGVSAAQVLLARRAITWDDVLFVSVHGRADAHEKLLAAADKNRKLVVFTGPLFSAGRAAGALLNHGYNGQALVGIDLSCASERLLEFTVEELSNETGLNGATVFFELEKKKSVVVANRVVGKFYGVGIGPGDPDLVTLKAAKILRVVDHIFVPRSDDKSESLAFQITAGLIGEDARVHELTFPMITERQALESHWGLAADAILDKLNSGGNVAFLTLGDPSLYSTFSYLMKAIRKKDAAVTIEIVPGVSSPFACAAAAEITLAEGGERVAIVPTPSDLNEVAALIDKFDTVVLLKVAKKLDRLMVLLAELELLDQAVLVKSVGLPQEQVVGLGEVSAIGPELGYFSTVIIKRRT